MSKLYNRQSVLRKRRYLRRNSTLPEKRLWKYLRKSQLGFKFRRQYSIGPYTVNFYCPALRLVIEVDGDSHYSIEAREDEAKSGPILEPMNTLLPGEVI